MTAGAGKYDDLASIVRQQADADMVVVIVVGGNKGPGFAVQCVDPGMLQLLPELLHATADDIEKQIAGDVADPGPARPWEQKQ